LKPALDRIRADKGSYYQGMEGVGSTRDELDGFDMRKSMPRDTVSLLRHKYQQRSLEPC
jgi:hypothetical protein